MARVSAIMGEIRSTLDTLTVTAYRQGVTGLTLDETLTGDLIESGRALQHLVYKVEPGETQAIERRGADGRVVTPVEVMILFRLREHIGGGGKEADIDDARDLAEEVAEALTALDDTSGDWTLSYVRHRIEGPDEDASAVAIRVTLDAIHTLGS